MSLNSESVAASSFPALLVGLALTSSNLEPLAVYYLARQLARINLRALAEHEGRVAPTYVDRIVSEEEARFLEVPSDDKVQTIEIDGFAGLLIPLALLVVLLLGAGNLFSFLYDIAFPPPDPLAF